MGHIGNWSERKRWMETHRLREQQRRWSARVLLETGADAFATCLECRRMERLDLRRLARGPRADHSLLLLEPRMRCRHCRSQGAVLAVLRPDPAEPRLRLVAGREG